LDFLLFDMYVEDDTRPSCAIASRTRWTRKGPLSFERSLRNDADHEIV
jgi:hypothetical protein